MRYSSLWIASCVLFLSVLVFAQIAPNPGHRGEQINVIDPTGAPTNPNTSLQIALNNLFDAIGGGGTSYWIQTPDRNLYYNDGNVGIGTTEPNNLLQVTGLINFDDTLFGTFLGYKAGISNTTGSRNSAVGYNALRFNTTGTHNSAVGMSTLYSNTTGSSNIAVGNNALFSNTTGYGNNAVGRSALYSNTTGYSNNAVGNSALNINTTGYKNSAVGNEALYSTTGNSNIAMGYRAGYGLTTGSNNILLGYGAGGNLTTGGNNIVIGYDIDAPLPTSANTLNIGNLIFATGVDGIGSTLSTGNVGIGATVANNKLSVLGGVTVDQGAANTGTVANSLRFGADTSGEAILSKRSAGENQDGLDFLTNSVSRMSISNVGNVGIGTTSLRARLEVSGNGVNTDTTSIRLTNTAAGGKTYSLSSGINQVSENGFSIRDVTADTIPFVIDTSGKVGIGATIPGQKLDIIGGNGRVQSGYSWLTNSDIRLKKDVTTLSGALDRISRLRGVRFNLNNTNESGFGKHVGFIAQELENEYPELVVTGEDGVKSVAYDKLTAPLVEAVKEQQAQIEKLQKIVCADHPLAEGCEQQ